MSYDYFYGELDIEKRKEHAKTQSEDGSFLVWDRILDLGDLLNFDAIYLSLLELVLGLTYSTDFGLGLTDIDIFHLDWDIELPDLEDVLRGIYNLIESISLEDVFREFDQLFYNEILPPDFVLDWENTLRQFFKIDLFPGLMYPNTEFGPFLRTEYAIYGIGVFGEDKYAPDVIVEQHYKPPTPKPLVKFPKMASALAKKLYPSDAYTAVGVSRNLVEGIKQRIDFLDRVLENGMFLGYAILGYSKFAPKVVENGKVFAEIEVKEGVKLKFPNLDSVIWGFYLGVTPLDLGRFAVTPEGEITTAFRNKAPYFGYWRGLRQLARFRSPVSTTVFRGRYIEMIDPHSSRKARKFIQGRSIVQRVRNFIYNRLRNRVSSVIELNAYVNAGVEYVLFERIGHKKSKKWRQYLTKEEKKKYWLAKWKGYGLDEKILLDLATQLESWVKL